MDFVNTSFEYITLLQYRLKAAGTELEAFKSGRKYQDMENRHQKIVRALECRIKELERELAQTRRDMAAARENWFEVFEELEREFNRKLSAANKKARQMEKRALKAEAGRDEALDKVTGQRHKIYEVETKLEEEKGKNLKLRAQLNRDYENSSLTSAQTIRRKKITNSREKTGRKPGGQPGHEGHCRKKQVPTGEPVLLTPSQEVLENPDFKKTSKTIVKQMVNIRLVLEVTQYHADVYYNSKTGERIHAQFPAGVTDEVNYGGSIKAFLFLLNNDCCTSLDKSRRFLSDLTDSKLDISKGMVSKLCREFAEKTEMERKKVYAGLLSSPVMHTDLTTARINGKSAYVCVCASPDGQTLYFVREKKGHDSVKGTPVEDYQGILVHDHDVTYYSYGSGHQECLAHILRYLKDSIQNEPERTWNIQMRTLIQEMIHYRNGLDSSEECSPEKIAEFEGRYRAILQKAKEEYEYIPADDYYKEGYNLYLRMEQYMENHLLFLYDNRIPATNNEAERLLST